MGIWWQRPGAVGAGDFAHHFGNDRQALGNYLAFKFAVVAGLQDDEWRLTSNDVAAAMREIFNRSTGHRH